MKQAKLVIIALLSLAVVSCGPAAPYDYIQGPGGQQSVICRDNNGTQFLMDYLLFTTLMRSGGYGAVVNNYHTYPGRYTYNPAAYSNYRPFRGQSYSRSNWGGYTRSNNSGSSFRTTTTPATSTFKRTTIPSTSSGSSWRSSSSGSSSGSSWRSSRSSGSSWRSSGGGSTFRSSSGSRRR